MQLSDQHEFTVFSKRYSNRSRPFSDTCGIRLLSARYENRRGRIGCLQPYRRTWQRLTDHLSCKPQRIERNQTVTIAILACHEPHVRSEPGHWKFQRIRGLSGIAGTNQIHPLGQDRPPRRDLIGRRIDWCFCTPARPMTIHPGNADRVIDQLCPGADFTVILMGKNVYRAIFIDPALDISPHKRNGSTWTSMMSDTSRSTMKSMPSSPAIFF